MLHVHAYNFPQNVLDHLVKRYPQVQWQVLHDPSDLANFDPLDKLIIILRSPIPVGDLLISAEQLWKNYLNVHLPETKLIIAGFSSAQAPNYIDLLDLPKNMESFLEQALPVHQYWNPVNTGALDMSQHFQRFFKGHGKESIMDVLINIQTSLKMTIDAVQNNGKDFNASVDALLNDLPQLWAEFKNRWDHYFPLFQCLPFFDLFEKSYTLINDLTPYLLQEHVGNYDMKGIKNTYTDVIQIKNLLKEAKEYE